MRRPTTSVILLLLCAAAVLAVLYAHRCLVHPCPVADRKEISSQKTLATEDERIEAFRKRCARLSDEAQAQSNRASTAEERYREEKETNEPLRKQIETMIAQEIVCKNEADKRYQDIRKSSTEAAEKAKGELDACNAKLADGAKERAGLGAELDSLKTASANFKEAADKARTEMGTLGDKLTNVEKEKAKLADELESLRKELEKMKVEARGQTNK